MSVLEYGVGVYGDSHHKDATVLLKQLACMCVGLHRDASVTTVAMLGELGLWPMRARIRMHVLRIYSNATAGTCNANEVTQEILGQHRIDYQNSGKRKSMWAHRVKEALDWVGKPEAFERGWVKDVDGDVKDAVYKAALRDHRADIARFPSLNPDYAALTQNGPLTMQWYTAHEDLRVVEAIARMRLGFAVFRERTQRWGANKRADRNERICPLCKAEGTPENARHMLITCAYSKWMENRQEVERRILQSERISAHFKANAQTIATKPDTWFAIMLCGTFPDEFGKEYNMPHAVIVRRKDATAKQVRQDRKSILALLGVFLYRWYQERYEMEAGFREQGV